MNKANKFDKYLRSFFIEFLPNERNLSSNTIKSYRDAFKLFFRYMKEVKKISPTKISLDDINSKNLLDYLNWLEINRKISVRTRNQRLSAFKSFVSFLQYQEPTLLVDIKKIILISQKKDVQVEISWLTIEQVTEILKQPDQRKEKGIRDAALLGLLYSGALRVQELIELTWNNLRLDDSPITVTVHGKGNKYRSIPLTESIKEILLNYRTIATEESIVFYNSQKRMLTRKGISYVLDKYVKMAKKDINQFSYKGKITCHTFRHSKASHMLQVGIPLVYIRDFLGHKSVTTTEIYAKLNYATKFDAVNKIDLEISYSMKSGWKEDNELISWLESI